MISPATETNKPCCCSVDLEADSPLVAPEHAWLPCMTSLLDFKLRRAQLLVFQDFAETLAKLDLRPAEFSVLAMIAKHPGQKQTTIAEGLGIKRANFVFLMDSIEKRGLAERRKGKGDRRSHSLYLTEEGISFVNKMVTLWREHENRMVARLGGHENLDHLTELLDRLLGRSTPVSIDSH